MRKILAVITTIITLFAIRESYFIFTSAERAVTSQKPILIVIAISIILPLILISIWLWRPDRKKN